MILPIELSMLRREREREREIEIKIEIDRERERERAEVAPPGVLDRHEPRAAHRGAGGALSVARRRGVGADRSACEAPVSRNRRTESSQKGALATATPAAGLP